MIDLHVHTNISDGSLSTLEVLNIAKIKGITTIAITNHDTTKGIKEAIDMGISLGMEVIPGIEISAYDKIQNKKVHILGYYIEDDNDELNSLCEHVVTTRNELSKMKVKEIISSGYNISWEEVKMYAINSTNVYKQHIMHALYDKGYCDNLYGELYNRFYKNNAVLSEKPIDYVDVVDAIKVIKNAGGEAVLAHPGQFDNFNSIGYFVENGLDGIEVFHYSHTEQDKKLALEIAKKYSLIITGGSDFHGFYSQQEIELGCTELNENLKDIPSNLQFLFNDT